MWHVIQVFLVDNQVILGSAASVIAILEIVFAPFRTLAGRGKKPDEVIVINQQTPMITPPNTVMMDTEAFITLQTRLREETRAELAQTHGEERKHLQDKIDTLNARLANPDEALAQQQAIITNLEDQLTRRGNQLGGDATLAAKTALEAGDFTKARALFETLAAETAPDVQTHADAAFALGQIAEAEIRWHDAAKHYARAAQLNPSIGSLYKASQYAKHTGNYSDALRFSTDLLDLARNQSNQWILANALSEQSTSLGKMSKHREAYLLAVEAESIARATFGPSDQRLSVFLSNLALATQSLENYQRSETLVHRSQTLFAEALEIDRNTVGVLDAGYAMRLNNQAGIWISQRRFAEAESNFDQALKIARITLTDSHPTTQQIAQNLIHLLQTHNPTSPDLPALLAAFPNP